MKILLLCNIIPKGFSEKFLKTIDTAGGWIDSLIEELSHVSEISLVVCFPYQDLEIDFPVKERTVNYYGFYRNTLDPTQYDTAVENRFRDIIASENPDLVHIFGTEYPHTLALIRAYDKPDKTVIHIQGLCSVCSRHYVQGIPCKTQKGFTIRDFLRQDNIRQQKNKFWKRGQFEIEAIKNVSHVMGRTEWDKICSLQINSNLHYHYVSEIMRDTFYTGHWNYENCERHSIFMSQGSYPIKGLHYAIETVEILKQNWPDVKLYIAGENIFDVSSVQKRARISSYPKYILSLIKKYNLHDHICFLGQQSAEQMKKSFLNCNVFLSASTIENSPNSIGEAMLLGVPVVSSNVGGVQSIVTHRETGYLYPADEPYMAAGYIDKIFVSGRNVRIMSEAEVNSARELYDRDKILKAVLEIYKQINSW